MSELVVVGGGTAGWLTSLAMLKHRPLDNITVIESDDIGILGAGEGTTPYFLDFLKYIDIPFEEIIKNCKGTIKLGINFENWLGDNSSYFHSFLPIPSLLVSPNNLEAWFNNGFNYESINVIRDIALNKKSCFVYKNPDGSLDETNIMSSFTKFSNLSLHFDARLLAKFLKEKAIERGCNYIEGKVSKIYNDNNNNITKLLLENKTKVKVDFLFDCTGFSRVFLEKHFKVKWKSYKDYLGLDRAIPFFQDHDNDVEPMTTAKAMDNGWVWRIPVNGRWGSGYVFSSNHTNADKALEEVKKIYGSDVTSPREFKFSAGILEESLKNNCLAIGLSQGFVEPLEATSIWVSLVTLMDFIDNKLLLSKDEDSISRFNKRYQDRQGQVLEFLRLHYISPRTDTEFWRTVKNEWKYPDNLNFKMKELKRSLIANIGYENLFPHLSWIQVMSGLNLFGEQKYQKNMQMDEIREAVLSQCISNKDFIKLISEVKELEVQ